MYMCFFLLIFFSEMDKKEYKCKFCDKVFSYGKNRNRHEKVGIFFIRGNVLRGDGAHCLGTKRGGCPRSLNPLRDRGQCALNSLGDMSALMPRGVGPSTPSEIPPVNDDF